MTVRRNPSFNELLSEIPKSKWQPLTDAFYCSMIECGARFGPHDWRENCWRCGRIICSACSRGRLPLRDPSGVAGFNLRPACGLCIRLSEGELDETLIAMIMSESGSQHVARDTDSSDSDSDAFQFARDAIGRSRLPVRPSAADVPIMRNSLDSSSILRSRISEDEEAGAASPLLPGASARRGSTERHDAADPGLPLTRRESRQQPAALPPPPGGGKKNLHKSTSLSSLTRFFARAAGSSGSAAADEDAAVGVCYNGGLHIRTVEARQLEERGGTSRRVLPPPETVFSWGGRHVLDCQGLLYFLATAGRTGRWASFADMEGGGLVRVSGCRWQRGGACDAACSNPHIRVDSWSEGVHSAWFCVELPEGLFIEASHYTLRHGSSGGAQLRSWQLLVSEDGITYDVARSHAADGSLAGSYCTRTWELPPGLRAARFFKVVMTGPNAIGGMQLACNGFEIYGRVVRRLSEGILEPAHWFFTPDDPARPA